MESRGSAGASGPPAYIVICDVRGGPLRLGFVRLPRPRNTVAVLALVGVRWNQILLGVRTRGELAHLFREHEHRRTPGE